MNQQTNPEQPKKSKKKFSRPSVAIKHKKVLEKMEENGGNVSKAIRDTGLYSPSQAEHPEKILNSKTWGELMEAEFPDEAIADRHNQLLRASRLEEKVFPTGPKLTSNKIPGSEDMSDEEIRETFLEADCKVLRILHRTDNRIVYFISPDNIARDKALDKVFKIKGRYLDEVGPRSGGHGNTYNFIFSGPVQEKVKIIEGEIKNMLTKKPDANNQQN